MNPADPDSLRNFLELSYTDLEKKNLEMKALSSSGKPEKFLQEKILKTLEAASSIKAITIAFCDLEGKLHMLDYDKKYFLSSYENMTFDGSSVKGLSELNNSDLRLRPDWGSFRYLPADVFGAGKVLLFAFICNHDGTNFSNDFRARLFELTTKLEKQGITAHMAPEIEGFLFRGIDAEQTYNQETGFVLVTTGGYFNALPRDPLRQFIDKVAEVQRALGFENEKDHGEVAPAQFEINYKYTDVLTACDQILMYKLTARQVAKLLGYTASFLPKPIAGINGSGMHTNLSLSQKGKNIFWDTHDKDKISRTARDFIAGVLYYAPELCLTICPSVNAYRRLDPHFEAPNEIKFSACDRSSMIRIPLGNEKSARIEFRSVSPDCNPYLALFSILHAGLSAVQNQKTVRSLQSVIDKRLDKKLPGTIYEAMEKFKHSDFLKKILGIRSHKKYLELKECVASRAPYELGKKIKQTEVVHHHEITNQLLWGDF